MERFLNAISEVYEYAYNDSLLAVFLIGICFIFIFGIYKWYRADNFDNALRWSRATPPILVSIGILGTFTGVLLGLMDFDVADIDKSTSRLISGLKFSFSTSVLGLFSAIVFRMIVISRQEQKRQETKDASVDDLLDKMTEVRDAISGEGEATIVTQLQKLRTSNQDGLNNLQSSFDNFAEKMGEINQKALVEAIQQVMDDFNAKITDQLGEDFKKLNESVQSMVQWQEQYKDHIETVTNKIELAINAIDKSKDILGEIDKSLQEIPKTTESLKEIISTIQSQIENIDGQMESFVKMREQAIEAMPMIEKRLNEMTDGLSDNVTKVIDSISNSSQGLSENVGTLIDNVKDTSNQMKDAVESQLNDIDQMSKTMRDSFNNAIEESSTRLEERLNKLDSEMEAEIKRTIELMGGKLNSLSQQFVDDYAPLTRELAKLVNIAKSVKLTERSDNEA